MSKDNTTRRHWVRTPDGEVIVAHYAGHAIMRKRTRAALENLVVAAATAEKRRVASEKRRRLEAMFGVGEERE